MRTLSLFVTAVVVTGFLAGDASAFGKRKKKKACPPPPPPVCCETYEPVPQMPYQPFAPYSQPAPSCCGG